MVVKVENMSERFKIPCVILAGGKSSRFGSDKALVFTKKQYEFMQNFFEEVYISTNEDKFDFEAKLIFDSSEVKAPIFALKDILEKFDEVFVISVDTFGVEYDDIKKLVEFKKVSSSNPLVGFYDKSHLQKIKKNIEKRVYKIYDIQETLNLDKEFLNINYYEEYKKLKDKI